MYIFGLSLLAVTLRQARGGASMPGAVTPNQLLLPIFRGRVSSRKNGMRHGRARMIATSGAVLQAAGH